MSSLSQSLSQCSVIPSNPDIAGIGVRTAIYAQSLLSFIPAFWAVRDNKVEEFKLESIETQSTTILITAFAILVSAVVQATTQSIGLTSFYGAIILDLSWMNNTNTFIWFMLFIHHERGKTESWSHLFRSLIASVHFTRPGQGKIDPETQDENQRLTSEGIITLTKVIWSPVLIIGSMHLSFMAAVGIWLWSDPQKFSESGVLCSSISILGVSIPLASPHLRDWSIVIYSLVLAPGFNLILPILFIVPFHIVCHYITYFPSPNVPTVTGLVLLAIINVIFIVDIEVMLHVNKIFLATGNSQWTFGQTLALLLLLMPLRDLLETMSQRREKKRVRQVTQLLQAAIKNDAPSSTLIELIDRGANVDAQPGGPGIKLATALQVAAYKGELPEVELLVEKYKANVNSKGGLYNTAIQAAICQGRQQVVKYLIAYGAKRGLERPAMGINWTKQTDYQNVDKSVSLKLWEQKCWDVRWGLLLFPPDWQQEHIPRDAVHKDLYPKAAVQYREMLEGSKQEEGHEDLVRAGMHGLLVNLEVAEIEMRCKVIAGFTKLITQGPFQDYVITDMPLVAKLLDDENEQIRLGVVLIFTILLKNGRYEDVISDALPQLLDRLVDPNDSVRERTVEIVLELSKNGIFEDDILAALPRLMNHAEDDSWKVCRAMVNLISELSMNPRFHDEIVAALPQLRRLLEQPSNSAGREATTNLFSRLAKSGKFEDEILATLPQFLTCLEDELWEVRRGMVNIFSELSMNARFHAEIVAALPQLKNLLEDSDYDVRQASINLFSGLSKTGKYEDEILAALPQLQDLLEDPQYPVRQEALNLFSELSKNRRFEDGILSALPQLRNLLEDANNNIRRATASLFSRLSTNEKFQKKISSLTMTYVRK